MIIKNLIFDKYVMNIRETLLGTTRVYTPSFSNRSSNKEMYEEFMRSNELSTSIIFMETLYKYKYMVSTGMIKIDQNDPNGKDIITLIAGKCRIYVEKNGKTETFYYGLDEPAVIVIDVNDTKYGIISLSDDCVFTIKKTYLSFKSNSTDIKKI